MGRHDPRPYYFNTTSSIEHLGASQELFLVKTHNLPDQGDCSPAIYLVRDGRDALVSYAWFHLLRDRGWQRDDVTPELYADTIEALIGERNSPFGTWSRNVESWVDRAERTDTVILRFEEFVQHPEQIIQAAERMGLGSRLPGVQVPTIESLRSISPWAIRRGVVGSWRDEFPPHLLNDFWRENGESMRRMGYT